MLAALKLATTLSLLWGSDHKLAHKMNTSRPDHS